MAEKTKTRSGAKTQTLFAPESALLNLSRTATLFDAPSAAQLSERSQAFIAIDEVGRGCLAGPVVVCATLWSTNEPDDARLQWCHQLRDSKKLSAAKREDLFQAAIALGLLEDLWQNPPAVPQRTPPSSARRASSTPLQAPSAVRKFSGPEVAQLSQQLPKRDTQLFTLCGVGIGSASSATIDSIGLSAALSLAAADALVQCTANKLLPQTLFFDGNRALKLPVPWSALAQILVTKGDDHLKSISASSVLAKVIRDRWMDHYAKDFPEFDLGDNRGYGTEAHRRALQSNGPSLLHRTSFLGNICPELFP